MSILPFRRRPERPAPRHSAHGHPHCEVPPAQAAAHADAFHGRNSAEDIAAAVRTAGSYPYPEPGTMTAASSDWAGAQDPAMELHHEAAAETALISSVQPRAYVQPRSLLPAIPLDAEIRLWVRAGVASGRYEDVDAFADWAERRVQRRCDRAQWHARQTLSAGWRQISVIWAAAGRAA